MNRLEKQLYSGLQEWVPKVSPSVRLQVYHKGRKRADLSLGKEYKYYDWASLTKIVYTAALFMNFSGRLGLNLNHRVDRYLPWFRGDGVTISHLLKHSAGLPWWKPFYKKLVELPLGYRHELLQDLLAKYPGHKAKTSLYSDLDMLVLGYLIEEFSGSDLFENWQYLQAMLPLPGTHFNINNKPGFQRRLYAPTEKCPWRKKVLKGEVHDDNAWAMGGVAPHAGLFGPIDDLSKWGLALRRGLVLEKDQALAPARVVKRFCRRAMKKGNGDWALGFMMPSAAQSGVGPDWSKFSVGHWGFTGTSLWLDPKADLLVAMLTNRVHPTRRNRKINKLRPLVHTFVYRELIG